LKIKSVDDISFEQSIELIKVSEWIIM